MSLSNVSNLSKEELTQMSGLVKNRIRKIVNQRKLSVLKCSPDKLSTRLNALIRAYQILQAIAEIKDYQPRALYPVGGSIEYSGGEKIYWDSLDRHNLREHFPQLADCYDSFEAGINGTQYIKLGISPNLAKINEKGKEIGKKKLRQSQKMGVKSFVEGIKGEFFNFAPGKRTDQFDFKIILANTSDSMLIAAALWGAAVDSKGNILSSGPIRCGSIKADREMGVNLSLTFEDEQQWQKVSGFIIAPIWRVNSYLKITEIKRELYDQVVSVLGDEIANMQYLMSHSTDGSRPMPSIEDIYKKGLAISTMKQVRKLIINFGDLHYNLNAFNLKKGQ